MSRDKFYITTPIYYVNAKPHIGHLYSTLLADISARWNKLKGKEVFFLTGLDEHGQKVAQAAEAAGMKPQEFVNSMVPKFTDVWERYELEYNKFIRTSDADHKKGVKKLIEKLLESDKIYKSSYSGFYCTPCETFINPQEAKEAKSDDGQVLCTSCQRETKQISEESYFFKLSEYQDKLLEFYAQNPNFIQPKERLNEVISFVKSGLKDLSFSRKSVSWGVPFPGDDEHTVYVWGDALTNYLSAVGYADSPDDLAKWWPADLHVMAKDIVRFHAVYWPAMLMAAGVELPKRELVHGFIIMDKQKMSKSLGNVVDPQNLADWYGTEPVRYYLARAIPTTQDGSFALSDLEECVRADLANNLGNLLSRTIALAGKNGISDVSKSELGELDSDCLGLFEGLKAEVSTFAQSMDDCLVHIALAGLCRQLSAANALFHKAEPWKLAKSDPEKFKQIIWTILSMLKTCATLLWPVIPRKAELLLKSIGHEFALGQDLVSQAGQDFDELSFTLQKLDQPLFDKPEEHSKKLAEEAEEKTVDKPEEAKPEYAEFSDLLKIKMAVGKIVKAEKLEKSEKLLKLEVDLGKFGTRQVLSGIAKSHSPEDIIGTSAVFVVNLKPRKIMGLESQAMIMCAVQDEKSADGEKLLEIVVPEKGSTPGTEIS